MTDLERFLINKAWSMRRTEDFVDLEVAQKYWKRND